MSSAYCEFSLTILAPDAYGMRMSKRNRVRDYQRATPINLTLTGELLLALDDIVRRGKFTGPTDYFRTRIRMDGGLDAAEKLKL